MFIMLALNAGGKKQTKKQKKAGGIVRWGDYCLDPGECDAGMLLCMFLTLKQALC